MMTAECVNVNECDCGFPIPKGAERCPACQAMRECALSIAFRVCGAHTGKIVDAIFETINSHLGEVVGEQLNPK